MGIQDIAGMNIAEIITHHGTDPSIKERTFIMFRDEGNPDLQSVTYQNFYRKSLEYGTAIQSIRSGLGVKNSERFHVGVFMQNIPEFLYILGGCAFTNSTLVGVNNAQVGEKLAFDINNIDIKILFVDHAMQPGTDGTFLDTVLKAKKAVGFTTLQEDAIFVTAKTGTKSKHPVAAISAILNTYAGALAAFRPAPLDPSNAAVIIFTSGTTGAPKGIEVSWKKLVDVGVNGTNILKYTEKDVGYICMPVNHSNSLYLNIMPALLNNAKLLLRRRFSVRNFVKDIEEVGATVWNCVGDPVQYLLNSITCNCTEPADFSHLPIRTVISTGTNAANRAAFTRIFGLEIFMEVYGSTEVGAITAVDANTPEYSVGKLLKEIHILNEEGKKDCHLALIDTSGAITNLDACAGEVIVSQKSLGASAFTSYYKLPAESAKKIITVNGEQYYRMGDLGAITEINGVKYLIFLGRTGDWVRFKGENWAPVDGEKIVMTYECIANAAIIGVPQSVGREDDPMYILEVENPAAFDVEKFVSFCKQTLPHYMTPRFIRLVTKMPMTDTMKLKKSVLKKEFYYRTPQSDTVTNDIMYEINQGKATRFYSKEYINEIAKYKDPTNQDTLKAFTKRGDLF